MSKSVERGDTDSRWHHLPKYKSWVGSRAWINRGEASRGKTKNKCLLNIIRWEQAPRHWGQGAIRADQRRIKHKVHRGKCLIRRGTHSPEIKGKGPKLDKHERHVRTRGKDERKQSATRHNNNTTTTPTHELRRKRYSNFLNHPTHPTLEYRLPSNYARRALLVRSMNHNIGQGIAMDPTRQNAALVQVISEPEPPICGTTMELSMLFNYFGYQGPQNRFRT